MVRKFSLAIVAMGVCMLVNPAFANTPAAEREIHLKGTSNTRDIGGYETSDLRTLREGQIIRSENLSRLTASDFQKLEEIGVKTVIDLRTNREHDQAPTVWVGDHPPQFYHFPVGDAQNDWFRAQRKMMQRNRFTQEQALEHMVEGYRMIAEEGPPSYQKLMDVVLDQSNWPVLIHCNAGKDRAGIATTLILEALGVDRETIMEEFLLTNEMTRIEAKAEFLAKESKKSSSTRRAGRSPLADAWLPIVGVAPEMLEAFYASVDEKYGSMDAFLTELGVDQAARAELAASLTTKQSEYEMGQ
ncbi:tyrosine-protein phosphatase [Pseudomonadota bacterium]